MDAQSRPERLGQLIRTRRVTLRQDRAPFATGIGMSPNTLARLERGIPSRNQSVYGRLEEALGWAEGSILGYLDGGPEPGARDDIVTYEPYPGDGTRVVTTREYADKLAQLDDRGQSIIFAAIDAALEQQARMLR